jgi:hypothetical protein
MGTGGTDRHADGPIPFRPPAGADDRSWLLAHSEATGTPVNKILLRALREYRERVTGVIAPPPQP